MNYFRKYNLIVGWLAFLASAVVYLLTIEPTTSLWDCPEFIATAYKLEVGHPPGAPLFMMITRLFTLLAPDTAHVAMMANVFSAICSALTILFLFWTITHFGRRIYGKQENELTLAQTWAILGAGIIGAMAYTFTDTFWFSAVEGEVYAMSSLFTAVVFWAILKWENVADQPHSMRWLILIAYLMGLSIGVHILNLLTIPAIVMVYYFKKYPQTTAWGVVKALLVSGAILLAVNGIVMPYSVKLGAWVDRMFNAAGAPVNAGFVAYALVLFAAIVAGVWITHRKGRVLANTILLCFGVIMLGYSSYTAVVIRAAANPPMNSNDPDNPYALYSLLNRDQYGGRPLLSGPYYTSPTVSQVEKTNYYVGDEGKYVPYTSITGYKYAPGFTYLFPRMYSSDADDIAGYKRWADIKGRKVRYGDQTLTVPTFGENLEYFFAYQLNHMYVRYFMWNFVGRQNDIQGTGGLTEGNWISGIKPIDAMHLGPQEGIPDEMMRNKARNTYYFIPFLLGLIGLLFHLNRDPKNFTIVLMLFILTGIALVVYFNSKPLEPRERDYVYAGSFYAYCIWIGFGVMWLAEAIGRIMKRQSVAAAAVATVVCSSVPLILAAQNWDDHDRSNRYVARDIGWDYLQSCLPNSIIMNYGDNDAFPLWYNQEVEGTRLDVRIMNMMYLSGDWYIDQMRIRSNESDAVPFSIPRSKYMGQNEAILVMDRFEGKTVDIRQAVDFIIDDDKRTKIELEGGLMMDYLPAKRLALPVSKANALASGIVAQKDAGLIVDTVYVDIPRNHLQRSDMMFLDLLATFDWKRPLYFSQPHSARSFGLADYLQFDGYAYRLVPIRTKSETLAVGRIDTEYLYPKLMETFRYGNVKDPKVYADYFTNYNYSVAQTRNAFARLAQGLIAQGDTVRAVEALDRAVQEMPFSQIHHQYIQTVPLINAYYAAKAWDKGDAVLNDYARSLQQYVTYFLRFRGAKAELIAGELDEKLQYLGALYNIARDNGRKAIEEDILATFQLLEDNVQ